MSVTLFGVFAVTFMVAMYALERRGRIFIALFSVGCVLSALYALLAGAWPFGVAEAIWAGIAWRRYRGD
ncbi:MAG TPA: hypothetical protein VMU98_01810 [Acidimicrobiales bacterium]|nr:hypothetical protein [Acidimicrobiales bacterium]